MKIFFNHFSNVSMVISLVPLFAFSPMFFLIASHCELRQLFPLAIFFGYFGPMAVICSCCFCASWVLHFFTKEKCPLCNTRQTSQEICTDGLSWVSNIAKRLTCHNCKKAFHQATPENEAEPPWVETKSQPSPEDW